jgi:uncharacterized protein YndB with AHSA1/START domain
VEPTMKAAAGGRALVVVAWPVGSTPPQDRWEGSFVRTGGYPMARTEVGTTIKRPVEDVFALVSDYSKNPQWAAGMVEFEIEKTSDGPIGVGTTWRGVGTSLGRRMESQIVYTEFEPNRRLVFEGTKPFPMTVAFTFDSIAGVTRIDQVVEAQPGGLFRLAGPLLAAAARRRFQGNLDNLRDLMEDGEFAD